MSLRSDLKNRLTAGETIVAPGAYDPHVRPRRSIPGL